MGILSKKKNCKVTLPQINRSGQLKLPLQSYDPEDLVKECGDVNGPVQRYRQWTYTLRISSLDDACLLVITLG